MFQEKFFQFIWKYQLFKPVELLTVQGQKLQVIYQGEFHHHSGPDFQNAKIIVDNTLWAGNIEIHTRSGDFSLHGHEKDFNYRHIILHVVYENDKEIESLTQLKIPTLELKSYIPLDAYKKYDSLQNCEDEIACGKQLTRVPEVIITNLFEGKMVERLERKCEEIKFNLQQNHFNWEETFYWQLSKHWGMKVNSDPFEWLAKSIPLNLIKRHQDQLVQLEALLLGQAGLLDVPFQDVYPKKLQNEYLFLKGKYQLQSISRHSWKFLRMRPSNFPPQRIAGFASLFHHNPNFFQRILAEKQLKEAQKFFLAPLSEYWRNHFIPDKPSVKIITGPGAEMIQNLMINCVIPFLFFYGRERGINEFEQRAIDWLNEMKGESNFITKKWTGHGIKPLNAVDSQGMIQQFNYYCKTKKCLDCAVGTYLLKN